MKILKIAAVVALSAVSLSALAKEPQKVGVADSAFTFSSAAVSGGQPVVIGAAIEGTYSSQTSVAIGTPHYVTGTNGGSYVTGTNAGHYVTGTNGGSYVTGTNAGHYVTGTNGGSYVTGTNAGHYVTGTN